MARVRQQETAPRTPRSRQTTQAGTDLSLLLRSRSFSLGGIPAALLSRLTANLQAVGGTLDPDAPAWIGEGPAPPGRPSIALLDEAGTLGPRSFGFLNNVDGIAPLLSPMAERPRRGGVALVVPRRDALPEVVPLLHTRRLGISWLISVGDGDPAEVMRFLSLDPATIGILLALGRGARAATLHGALSDKQTVLLELGASAGPGREGMLCRAVARRAGASAVSSLEEWLAHGALFDAAARTGRDPKSRRAQVAVVVIGAGADFVATEAQRARLPGPITVESDDEEGLGTTLAQAAVESDLIVLCGDPEVTAQVSSARPLLRVDPSQPERLRALLRAVAERPGTAAERKPLLVKPEADRVQAMLADLPPPLYVGGSMVTDEILSDHDTKRLLRAYGARVSRQAPANTVTAVLRIAGQIGLPVVLVVPPPGDRREGDDAVKDGEDPDREYSCPSQAELKRQATLLLSRAPHIMVREFFPDSPRVRVAVTQERGLGSVLRVGGEATLLPIYRGEARDVAEPLAVQHGIPDKGLAELLGQISSCASDHPVSLDLVVCLLPEPAVVSAQGTLKRQRGR